MDKIILMQYSSYFLQMKKILDFPWKNLISCLQSEEFSQLDIIEETVCHSQIENFPPSSEYVKQFLKKLIYELENNGLEVNELLYNKYLNFISGQNTNVEEYYRTYSSDKGFKVILKETQNLIVEGTTGMRTWQASHVLADYCLENLSLFDTKEVLELGAGLGLTGLTILKAVKLKAYTFTDHHPKVLEFLKHNVSINLSLKDIQEFQESNELVCKWQEIDIQIKHLDWEKPNSLKKYDFIIGADIIFDTRLIPSLLDVTIEGLKENGKAVFASTIRNEETLHFFLNELERRGLYVDDIEERRYQESSSQPVDNIKIITFCTNGIN